jgi:hypothetical protein
MVWFFTVTTPNKLTTWITVLEKLTVLQIVQKFAAFYRTQASLPLSQKPATIPYPEPDHPNLRPLLFL